MFVLIIDPAVMAAMEYRDVVPVAAAASPAAGQTISTAVTGAVVINLANSPLTVSASGRIVSTGTGTDGVGGAAGSAVSIVNDGTISAAAGIAIALAGSGTVTNGDAGRHAASIAGDAAAVRIAKAPAIIANSATVAAAGTAIDLRNGGSIDNDPASHVHGGKFGVFVTGGTGTIVNGGEIVGADRIGVDLAQGGSIANAAGASILGNAAGVFFTGSGAALDNAGRIQASGAAGVDVEAGGRITNAASGAIAGATFGIFVAGGVGTVTNNGVIEGTDKFGVDLKAGGNVANGPAARISSKAVGIAVYGGQGSVTNEGTIAGGIDAVRFSEAGNRVVVGPNAVFRGEVVGGADPGNTLEFAGGRGSIASSAEGTGAVSANGQSWHFSNFGTLDIGQGGVWSIGKEQRVRAIINQGTVSVAGTLHVAALRPSEPPGLFSLEPGAELSVASIAGSAARIRFANGSRLVLDNPGGLAANADDGGALLQAFGLSNAVILRQFGAAPPMLHYDRATGILRVSSGTQTASLAFDTATVGRGVFHAASDGTDGIAITLQRQ